PTWVVNEEGGYCFAGARFDPGHYMLRIRAAGYELEGPPPVEVVAQKTTQLDLKLRQAEDLASQLSNGEWLLSMPGTDEQKQCFLSCVSCHTVERIVRSRYNAD